MDTTTSMAVSLEGIDDAWTDVESGGHGAPYYIQGGPASDQPEVYQREDTGSFRLSVHPEVAWTNADADATITASGTRFFLRVRCLIDFEAFHAYTQGGGACGSWAIYVSDTPLPPETYYGTSSYEIGQKLEFGLSSRNAPNPTIKLYAHHLYAAPTTSGSNWVMKVKSWHPYADFWDPTTGNTT